MRAFGSDGNERTVLFKSGPRVSPVFIGINGMSLSFALKRS